MSDVLLRAAAHALADASLLTGMAEMDRPLGIDGIALLTAEEGAELSYSFPEGAEIPAVLEDFLLRKECDAGELAAAVDIDGDAWRAAGDSDRAQELLRKTRERLGEHPDLE